MGSSLDSQRFAYYLSKRMGIPQKYIHSLVMGEHGKSMTPIFSNSYYNGSKITFEYNLSEKDKTEIIDYVRNSAPRLVIEKGGTSFAPAIAITRIVEAILNDTNKEFPVSAYLDGEQ